MSEISSHRRISMYDSDIIKTLYDSGEDGTSHISSSDQDCPSSHFSYTNKDSDPQYSVSNPEEVNLIRKHFLKPLPSSFVYSTTLLYREIMNNADEGRRSRVLVPTKSCNHKASVTYILDLSKTDRGKLDAFDFLVHDYIFTLYNEGHRYITQSNFIRMVRAKDNIRNYNPPRDYTDEVIHSLKRLQNTRLEIHCEEQFDLYNLSPDTPSVFRGSAIDIAFMDIPYGKTKQRVIELCGEPVLLSYSKPIKQFASFDRDLLRLDFSHQTTDRVFIAHYLIRQIMYMKSSNKKDYPGNPRSNVVRLDTLIERSKLSMTFDDIVTDSRKRNVCVKSAMKILAGFKEKGFIFDFEKKGKKMDISFHIHLEKPQEE